MADEHQIKHTLDGFAVSDPFGETTVFSTKAEAKDIESAMQNGRRFGAAKMLVETAIQPKNGEVLDSERDGSDDLAQTWEETRE
jgi:hypothetical protein